MELELNLHEVYNITITVMVPTRVFSLLKAASSDFTFKTRWQKRPALELASQLYVFLPWVNAYLT